MSNRALSPAGPSGSNASNLNEMFNPSTHTPSHIDVTNRNTLHQLSERSTQPERIARIYLNLRQADQSMMAAALANSQPTSFKLASNQVKPILNVLQEMQGKYITNQKILRNLTTKMTKANKTLTTHLLKEIIATMLTQKNLPKDVADFLRTLQNE